MSFSDILLLILLIPSPGNLIFEFKLYALISSIDFSGTAPSTLSACVNLCRIDVLTCISLSSYTEVSKANRAKHACSTHKFLLCQGLLFPVHLLQLLAFAPDPLAVVPVGIKKKVDAIYNTIVFPVILQAMPVREERVNFAD